MHELTGPVSFMVRLQDGRIIRRHQDHLRCRTPDGEPEKLSLLELKTFRRSSLTLALSPPEMHTSEDGSASENSEESTMSIDST